MGGRGGAVLAVVFLSCLRAGADEEEVTIAFTRNQRVSDFLGVSAATLGRPILYDPGSQRVGSTMGMDVSQSVPKGKAFDTIRAILAFYDITLLPSGPKGKEIFLALDAPSTNGTVKARAEFVSYDRLEAYADRDGLWIFTAIPVRHVENPTMFRVAFSTMVTPAGLGRVHEVPRMVVLGDYAPTVVAIARVIRALDVDTDPLSTEAIVLRYAPAAPLAATLKELFAREGGPRIVAYESCNAIVVVAAAADLARIREVVRQLDVK